MSEIILSVENLKMYYDTTEGRVPAVDGVSFSLSGGQTYGILGESGCGKSSLASSILRVLPDNGIIESGKVLFKGENLLELSEDAMRRKRWTGISMVFQGAMNALNPVYTVRYQIAEAMRAHGETPGRKKEDEKISRLLETVGLDSAVMNCYPHQLSGGMKQRAVIAMALSCSPEVIIADEPTTALDVIVQDRILANLKEIQQRLKTAMIYISHDVSVLAETADRIAVMYAGSIVEEAPAADIFERPLHPYTRGLIDAFPSVRGPRKKLTSIRGEPPSLINPPPGCRFHPRCRRALEKCGRNSPGLAHHVRGRLAACFNPERAS